jgi:hypothetical protein
LLSYFKEALTVRVSTKGLIRRLKHDSNTDFPLLLLLITLHYITA